MVMTEQEQASKILEVAMKAKSVSEFLLKIISAEETLQALEIHYNNPDKEEVKELSKEFLKIVNNSDVKVKVRTNHVEVHTYRNEGCSGDWTDVDVYSYFGFRNLVEYVKIH